MKRAVEYLVAFLVALFLVPVAGQAEDVTFHVHKEGNPGQSLLYLQTGGPDAASTFSESANLKNATGYFSIPSIYKYLSTAPGTRVIPSGSSFEFKLWMMKTANWGVMYPNVVVYLFDNFSNPNVGGRQLCSQTGDSTTVIGTSLGSTPKVVNCSVSTDVVIGPNQVLVVWIQTYVATSPGNHNVGVRLYYEGTLDGNYDSRLKFPSNTWTGPVISSLSPTNGYPTTTVTVNGTGFGATQGSSTLKVNGSTVTPTSWSDTAIQYATASSGDVTVTVGGLTSNPQYFSQSTPPTPSITSLSPSTANIGQTVTVNGTNFGATQGSSTLTLGGSALTPSSWGSTSIQFVVPTWASTGSVRVNVFGVNSNTQTLTVLRPTISSLSPSTQTVGNSVTVNGSNFGSTQGSSTLALDGTTITPSSWGASAIQFTVPSWATTGSVTVTVNGAVSNASTLTVTPVIANLSPDTGQVGTAVTINGTGFGNTQGTSVLKYDGIVQTPTNWSATAVTFNVPVRPTATVLLTIKGVNSNTPTFTVTAPVISDISPTSGGLGSYVTINGTGFGSIQSSSEVRFNGGWSNPVSWSATKIIAPVSNDATTGPVTVKVAGLTSNGVTFTLTTSGQISGTVRRASDQAVVSGVLVKALQSSTVMATATSAGDGTYTLSGLAAGLYDVVAYPTDYLLATYSGSIVAAGATSTVNISLTKPVISSVNPPGGPVGSVVTITGVRFGLTQGTSTVTFNGTAASASSWNDTTVVATVPSGATTGPLVVTVGTAASNAITFGVGTGTISGTITQSGSGTPIVGAFVEALRNNAVIATDTTVSGGTYAISNLLPDTYDVRVSASGYGSIVNTGNSVSAGGTTTVNAALGTAGRIGGKVTKADGVTPISGAAVTISIGPTTVATAFTNGSGDYLANALAPATYKVQAGAAGYIAQTQTGVMVTASSTTTKNFSLLGQSAISYAYDTLGRLIGVTDSLGDTATYQYDAVGNLLSINRYSSAQISIIGFAPTHGAVGTQVTIYGTAFSPTPSSNTVTFNGTAATITSASTTQLVVTVPAGATTGAIGVTSPSGSTTSGSVFSIP